MHAVVLQEENKRAPFDRFPGQTRLPAKKVLKSPFSQKQQTVAVRPTVMGSENTKQIRFLPLWR